MNYLFNISQLEILNTLVFDASVDLDQLNSTLTNMTLGFIIERRTFESVTRKKILFWTWTYLKGKKSLFRFTDIQNCVLAGINNPFKDTHFINSITAVNSKQVIITTLLGLTITLSVGNDFKVQLTDIEESNFGKGTCFGKIGYKKDEWTNYLNERNYTP